MLHRSCLGLGALGLLTATWTSGCVSGDVGAKSTETNGGSAGKSNAKNGGNPSQTTDARNGGAAGISRSSVESAAGTTATAAAGLGNVTKIGVAGSGEGVAGGPDARDAAGAATIGGSSITSTNGIALATGGTDSMGGDATTSAGASFTGGAIADGGRSATGGTPATGGTASGGEPSTGGVATGGAATGGAATGGVATGGVAAGGVATGGVATGGVAAGGATGTAGACVISPGNALSFDNAAQPQYVSVDDDPALRLTSSITVEAWVRLLAGDTIILSKPNGTGAVWSMAFWFQNSSNGTYLCWGVGGSATTGAIWTLGVGSWHHLAATYESGTQTTQQLYIDGILVQITNVAASPTYDWHPMLIGAVMANGAFLSGFKGTLDEVRIYSSVRTAQQIAADMKGLCSTVSDPDLVAYYPFDEGSGTVTYDASPNHLDGTLGSPTTGTAAAPTWTKSTVPF